MTLTFYKYQGAGNDFVMIDNRNLHFNKCTHLIKQLCDRRFGIGADGLILLENDSEHNSDFRMVYYNADGNESTMCGNGGRCIVAFANFLGLIYKECSFIAIDGMHKATFLGDEVDLQMTNVEEIIPRKEDVFLNTGSPHHVSFVERLEEYPIVENGRRIRNEETYASIGGTNVNFVSQLATNSFAVRTYERGVEDETLACGTGVTAVAIAAHHQGLTDKQEVQLKAMGGELSVRFHFDNETNSYRDVWLKGPAKQVFKGEVLCEV